MQKNLDKEFVVVGIGSSAGGLEALQEFVRNIPKKSNCVYIVAQHLSPTYKSMMVDLLSRESSINIVEIEHGMSLKRDVIYITPPNNDVVLQDNKLYLRPPLSQVGPKPSIDILFESIARDKKDRAIGLILSGTGSDGSLGVRAIKAEGGITMAQEPESTKYDGMVISAINTGNIDFVLNIEGIIEEIVNISKHSKDYITNENNPEEIEPFQEIFKILKDKKRVDFKDYKISTIQRRMARRMAALKIVSIIDYMIYIKTNLNEVDELYKDILIGVTYFFRDSNSFNELNNTLSHMIKEDKRKRDIRVWIPGCSTGEETYSIAILIHQILGLDCSKYNIQIFATDIDVESLDIARKGKYPQASLQDMEQFLIEKYFIKQGEYYSVIKPIRDMVIFSYHDVTMDPPFLRVDLISCRNLLIYFNQRLQEKVFPIFHYALNNNGVLFLGKSESVGKFTTLFTPIDKKHKIYQAQITNNPNFKMYPYHKVDNYKVPAAKNMASMEYGVEEATRDAITNIFLPNSVVVNANHDIVYFQKELIPFLKISAGSATFNIFRMIDDQLNLELRSVLHSAIKEKTSKKSRFIKFDSDNGIKFVQIIVAPLTNLQEKELYLVSFLEELESDVRAMGGLEQVDYKDLKAKELEYELATTKEHLQTVIEELETSNEEMQSLNEELQSSNEELQSSNEELETSNEELQSSNEELQTAYAEINHINSELEKNQSDLKKSNIKLEKESSKLQIASDRFQLALESANSAIFEYTISGRRRVYFDKKFANAFGYNKSDLRYIKNIHTYFLEIIDKKQKDIYIAKYLDFIKRKGSFNYIALLNTSNRGYRYFHIYEKVFLDNGIDKVVGILRDVDSEYRDRLLLELRKDRLNTTFKTINNILIISDGRNLIDVNRAFEKLFNMSVEEFRSKYNCICELFEEVKDDSSYLFDESKSYTWIKKVLDNQDIEYKVKITIDKIEYHFKVNANIFKSEDEKKTYLVVFDNITKSIKFQEELKKQLEIQLKEIRKKDDMLINQSKSAAMGEMISAIAHQWRQPLNVLSLYIMALETKYPFDEDTFHDFLEKSEAVIEKMSHTIDDFRDFFRPNKSKELFSIKDAISRVLDIIEVQLIHHNIDINKKIDDDSMFLGYKSEFEQSIINILTNAKDALILAQESSQDIKAKIDIELKSDNKNIILEISDNAGGIKDNIINNIFDPYFSTKFENQGTRLGLYMTKVIIEKNMGGKIDVANFQDGAKFTIKLPLSSKDVVNE
jgi:two-component system CheB/CheR fusion protein